MRYTGTKRGIVLALGAALISGVSIFLNKFALGVVDNAVVFTTLKNSLVGTALCVILIASRRPAHAEPKRSVRPYSRSTTLGLLSLAIIGGSVPFLLFFQGLATASAPSAALIQKSIFLWVALIAIPMLNERPGIWALGGLGLLASGQLIIGWPQGWGWGSGETLILIATLLWACETVLAKRLLRVLSMPVAATARMAGGALVMWLYVAATGQANGIAAMSPAQWAWVILTSIILLGYVATWYGSLQYAPATVVTSILVLGAVITGLLSLGIEGGAGNWIGWIMILGGSLLVIGITREGKNATYPTSA
jgi:drug/metabolite transporter (DMT)-like permease